jgi:uncharacterized membrane protein YidH (DUF202 family)
MNKSPGTTFRTQNIEWQARLQGVALASFRSRALAFLIDAAIVGLLLFAPSLWSNTIALKSGESFQLSLEYGSLVSVAVAVLYFGLATFRQRRHAREANRRHPRYLPGTQSPFAVALCRARPRVRRLFDRSRFRLPSVLHAP